MSTGAVEAIHSSKLKYLPKYKSHSMLVTIILTMLTVIEHNKHAKRHIRKPVPKTFHGTPKPSKQELLDKRITRMSKPGPSIELRK